MQINLDPTRWLVSFAGFVVDWMMTREWSKIALTSIPLMFLATVAGLVFWGSRLDKHQLATRYLELGEKEISEWEASWAPDRSVVEASKDSKLTPTSEATGASESKESDAKSESTTSDAPKTEKKELSRFAEVLFRRVQLLEPNERSQFVIGVTMAQRGATGQAQKMLAKIAPDNRPGYAPAHAWIAQSLLRQPPTLENAMVLKHHVKEAAKWDRVPDSILLLGSKLLLSLDDKDGCLDMLKKAAELNPENSLFLAQYAKHIDNKVLIEYSTARAEKHYRSQLERDPYDLKARIGLIQALAECAKLNEAEEVVRAGMQIEPSIELTRALSEVFRLRYLTSLKQEGESWTGDLQMLDMAMRTDPTNPMIGEEIAKLARLNGKSPGDELINKLQQFLAEGKATAATHAWIAELYLLREDYAKALPYLEQVVTRMPNSAQYLNNLAFVLDEIAPDRRQEALKLAERAVQIDPRAADYFDTLAKVLAGLDRRTEAIAAIQSAIERQPARKDFHESITVLYVATGNAQMAEQHRNVVKRIVEMEEKAAAAAAQVAEKEKANESGPVQTNADSSTNANAPEANPPEANAPEANAPEANAPEANAPEANAPEANAPEPNPAEPNAPEPNPAEANPAEPNSPEVPATNPM